MKTGSRQLFKKKDIIRHLRVFSIIGFICLSLLSVYCSQSKKEANLRISAEMDPLKIIGIGRVEPEFKIVNLSSEIAGIIAKIFVQPGEKVRRGQIMLELSDAIEKAQVKQAEIRIQVQRSKIEEAKASVAEVKAKISTAKNNYLRFKKLVEIEAKPQSLLEQAQAEYESLVAEMNRLESAVTSSQYMYDQYRADLELRKAQLAQKSIAAPGDGLLLSIETPIGSFISPGQTVGSFAPESPLSVWCEIDELFAGNVQLKQKAFIRSPGKSEKLGEGTVSFLGPWLRKKSIFSDDIGDLEDRRVREVCIRLDSGTGILIGSRVECVIMTAQ